jgi:hypothetical protein
MWLSMTLQGAVKRILPGILKEVHERPTAVLIEWSEAIGCSERQLGA